VAWHLGLHPETPVISAITYSLYYYKKHIKFNQNIKRLYLLFLKKNFFKWLMALPPLIYFSLAIKQPRTPEILKVLQQITCSYLDLNLGQNRL